MALFVALRTLLLRIALVGLALTLLALLALALTAFRFIRLLTHCVTSSLSRPTRRDSLATHVAIVDRSVLQTSCQRVPDAASPGRAQPCGIRNSNSYLCRRFLPAGIFAALTAHVRVDRATLAQRLLCLVG